MRPPTACKTARCPGTAITGGLCKECLALAAPAAEKKFVSKFDDSRPWRKLYWTARWRHPVRGLQVAILNRDPICKECKRLPSEIADHIRDHRGNVEMFFDARNLRGICKPCHDKKTGSMHGGGDRTPKTEALVGGRVVEQAPPVTAPSTDIPAFDFLAAANRHSICQTCRQQKRMCKCA